MSFDSHLNEIKGIDRKRVKDNPSVTYKWKDRENSRKQYNPRTKYVQTDIE